MPKLPPSIVIKKTKKNIEVDLHKKAMQIYIDIFANDSESRSCFPLLDFCSLDLPFDDNVQNYSKDFSILLLSTSSNNSKNKKKRKQKLPFKIKNNNNNDNGDNINNDKDKDSDINNNKNEEIEGNNTENNNNDNENKLNIPAECSDTIIENNNNNENNTDSNINKIEGIGGDKNNYEEYLSSPLLLSNTSSLTNNYSNYLSDSDDKNNLSGE